MSFTFHPLARKELDHTVDYYEEQQSGLGLEFAKEVYATIQRILQFPKSGSLLSRQTRRSLVNRFPYGILYQIRDNEILVVAISHLNRRPDYWKGRLN